MAPRMRKGVLGMCRQTGCRVATTEPYCSKHKAIPAPRTRDPFLDSVAWKRLRDSKASETPWCEECLRDKGIYVPMVDVDHIKPRRTHPHLALTPSNLQSLCLACHGRKTARGE